MQPRKRILSTAGLAGVLLATASAGAGAATVRAPVIKEVFTPLKCTHDQTTLAIEACAEQQILKSDKAIDALNARIFAKLTASGKRDFVSGHNAWLKYRGAYCLSESDVYQGGTAAGIVDAKCTASVNTAHVTELRGFLSSLSQS